MFPKSVFQNVFVILIFLVLKKTKKKKKEEEIQTKWTGSNKFGSGSRTKAHGSDQHNPITSFSWRRKEKKTKKNMESKESTPAYPSVGRFADNMCYQQYSASLKCNYSFPLSFSPLHLCRIFSFCHLFQLLCSNFGPWLIRVPA